MDALITPQRAAEIRRAAIRHAGRMILVSIGEWEPRKYAAADARTADEADLLIDEVEKIANEILGRLIVGTRQPCSKCGFSYRVKQNGRVGHHHGVDAAGFSTGRPCPGVGRPPVAFPPDRPDTCRTAPEPSAAKARQHLAKGTNAEDCPACRGTNPPYPFLCPGPNEESSR